MERLKVGVLASGRGSNFQAIIDSAESGYLNIEIAVLITDNPKAFAIDRAKKHEIPYLVITPKQFSSKDEYFMQISSELQKLKVGLVILAGFMRIVRKPLVDAFRNRILNIHPALLPAFPGLHSQKQAVDHGVKISGCTVHFVDEGMDTGPIVIQAAVPVRDDDTEDALSTRILKLEHKIFPQAIKLFSEGKLEVISNKVQIKGVLSDDNVITSPSLL